MSQSDISREIYKQSSYSKSRTFDSLISRKLQRIKDGGDIRYMDMFAGCGGISLGFLSAGFKPVASVEIDMWAAKSHGANFSKFTSEAHCEAHFTSRDVTQINADDVFNDLGLKGKAEDQIDVLVGGPPCQAFARIGRAKLREQAHKRNEESAGDAFLIDGRVNLWERYVHYIRQTKPLALLMENVPDILNHGGTNVAELVSKSLAEEGYEVAYTLLNAAWYGVPQIRERMILIGFHKDTKIKPEFPCPTHHLILPSGYTSAKMIARKVLRAQGSSHHRLIADPEANLPPATSTQAALGDLPKIFALDLLKKGQLRRGAKDPLERVDYKTNSTTDYSNLMRNWYGFETLGNTTGHVFRYLPRDYKIFAEIEEGWDYPKIHSYVESKIESWLFLRNKKGLSTDRRITEIKEYERSWRIPYDPNKFPNKWWKLESGKPSRTLMAHLGKDSYSHIHFDSKQARTITVREAARLQSFPDGFIFKGSMNPAFKQIGNAVPPLLAYAVAVTIKKSLGRTVTDDMRVKFLNIPEDAIQNTTGLEI